MIEEGHHQTEPSNYYYKTWIKTLVESPQWFQLYSSLTSSSTRTISHLNNGRTIAHIASRALQHLQLYTNLPTVSLSRDISSKHTLNTEHSHTHTTPCAIEAATSTSLIAFQEITWEKIHLGNWKDVDVLWRDAYSLACICQALYIQTHHQYHYHQQSILSENDTKDDMSVLQKSLYQLDMATLMGGTLFREYIDRYIADIVSKLNEYDKDETIDDDATLLLQQPLYITFLPTPASSTAAITTSNEDRQREENISLALLLPPPGSNNHAPIHSEALPSLVDFAQRYYNASAPSPVVITHAIQHWPALTRWNNTKYLNDIAGYRTVPVEVGRHYCDDGWSQKLMLFKDFIETVTTASQSFSTAILSEDAPPGINIRESLIPSPCCYLAQHGLFDQIPQLAGDIMEPEYCALGHAVNAVNAWFGPPGTITPAHTDPYHNLLCQVVGKKYIRLYAPECGYGLYPDTQSMLSNTSQVDIDRPDHNQHPLFSSLPYVECILEAGQMLYIPKGWWHYVKSLSISWSVSYWFE